jgi:TolB-like protein/class 3 adenylate cyclase
MTTPGVRRKLAAILSADVQGYSRLMGEEEEATVRTLTAYREVMSSHIEQHRGRVVDSTGDNLLAEFPSVVDAVQCAVEIQEDLKARNAELPERRRMAFRLGINLGDVIVEGERIYGDGVNIAARIQGLAAGGGVCLSRSAYEQVENKLPLTYEDLGGHEVKNIAKPVRAYRAELSREGESPGLVVSGKVRLRRWRWIALALLAGLGVGAGAVAIWNLAARAPRPPVEVASVERMAFPLPDKPSIAVLPFANMSGDPGQEYIADGITENIITSLSNISEMFVIARNSTFTYKGRPVKVQQVSEELGVRYVLEGSVQKSGDRVRVTAQLIDATEGHHLWSKRYDRDLQDFFGVQDEITKEIVVALQVELMDGEQARLWHKSTNDLETWGQLVRAGRLFERFNKEDNVKARELLDTVLEKEPENAFAWTMLAWTHLIDSWLGLGGSGTESIQQAVSAATRAEELDITRPEIHSLWSTIHLLQGDFENAMVEGEKAVALGPSNSLSHILFANVTLHVGEFNRAIALGEKAVRLTPYCPYWFLAILAESYRQAGDATARPGRRT